MEAPLQRASAQRQRLMRWRFALWIDAIRDLQCAPPILAAESGREWKTFRFLLVLSRLLDDEHVACKSRSLNLKRELSLARATPNILRNNFC